MPDAFAAELRSIPHVAAAAVEERRREGASRAELAAFCRAQGLTWTQSAFVLRDLLDLGSGVAGFKAAEKILGRSRDWSDVVAEIARRRARFWDALLAME